MISGPQNSKVARQGSAMTELVVSLVVLVSLTAGLVQIGTLTHLHTGVLVSARRRAGEAAFLDLGSEAAPVPLYIQDWTEGPDGRRHTRDDLPIQAASTDFADDVVSLAAPDTDAWELLDAVPASELQDLRLEGNPSAAFGLVRGSASRSTNLLPAVQSLLYAADSVTLESEVWMTRLGGLY